MSGGRQPRIASPPVQSDLLGLVDRADEQTNLNRQQLDVGEIDLDVAGNHQTFVEHPIQDVDEAMRTRRVYELRQSVLQGWRSVLPQSAERSEIDVEVFVSQAEHRLQLVHPMVQFQQRQAKALDFDIRERAAVHPANRLMLQNFA